MPGRADIEAIALAKRLACPLVTHDRAAADLASRARVATLDILDVTRLAVEAKVLTWAQAERYCGVFPDFAWLPEDWQDSGVRDTVTRRTYPNWLTNLLESWQEHLAQPTARPETTEESTDLSNSEAPPEK